MPPGFFLFVSQNTECWTGDDADPWDDCAAGSGDCRLSKEPFYTVTITFDGITAESERFPRKTDAQRLREKVLGKTVIVQSVTHKERKEKPPKLFDLTLLQREANRLLGYTAQQTLDYAQALYEKKLLTYPRTDSNFLTEEMESSLPALLKVFPEVYRLPIWRIETIFLR